MGEGFRLLGIAWRRGAVLPVDGSLVVRDQASQFELAPDNPIEGQVRVHFRRYAPGYQIFLKAGSRYSSPDLNGDSWHQTEETGATRSPTTNRREPRRPTAWESASLFSTRSLCVPLFPRTLSAMMFSFVGRADRGRFGRGLERPLGATSGQSYSGGRWPFPKNGCADQPLTALIISPLQIKMKLPKNECL